MSSAVGRLTFKQQGTCKVNGQDGWYYDDYSSSYGFTVTFCYNSNKVAVIDMGEMTEGAKSLLSFNKRIPDNVKLGITTGWKGQGSPAPPTVASNYKDPDVSKELACGTMMGKIVITDKRPLTNHVYASAFVAASGNDGGAEGGNDIDVNNVDKVTVEGIKKAYAEILDWCKDKTTEEIVDAAFDGNNDFVCQMLTGNATGQDVERAVARAIIVPSPTIIGSACAGYIITGHEDEAMPMLEKLHELQPDDHIVASNLVECLIEKRMAKPAMILIDQTADKANSGELFGTKGMLLMEEGKYDEGFDALFKALSLGYCGEEMAQVLMQLKSYITYFLPREDDPTPGGRTIDEVMDRIFSENNLELLRKGMTFGKEYETTMHRDLSIDWMYSPGSVEACVDNLKENEQKVKDVYDEVNDKIKPDGNLFSMGDENLMMLKEMPLQENEALDLEGSSNFWSAFVLGWYYELRLNHETGFYCAEDQKKHELVGWGSSGYYDYWNTMKAQSILDSRKVKSVEDEIEAHDKKMESGKVGEKDLLRVLELQDKLAKVQYTSQKAYSSTVLTKLRSHYNNSVLPLAKEYVEAMETCMSYIPERSARRQLFYQAHSQALFIYKNTIREGANLGEGLVQLHQIYDTVHEQYVRMYEEYMKSKLKESDEERIAKIESSDAFKAECRYFEVDSLKNFNGNNGLLPEFSRNSRDLSPFGLFTISAGTVHGRIFFEYRNNATGKGRGFYPGINKTYKLEAANSVGRENSELYKEWIANKVKDGAKGLVISSLKLMPIIGDKASDFVSKVSKAGVEDKSTLYWYYGRNGNLLRRGFERSRTYSAGGAFSYTDHYSETREASRNTISVRRHRHEISYSTEENGTFTVSCSKRIK